MTENKRVRDPKGHGATLAERSDNGTLILLRADDGRQAWIAPTLVEDDLLTVTLDSLLGSVPTLGLLEERLIVGRRVEETGVVRLRKEVVEHTENVRLDTMRETVEVERVAVGRVVEGPVEIRYEGDTTIVPVLEERMVVEKRLVLIEEIRLTRKRETVSEEREVTLRKEQAMVERDAPTQEE